MWHHKETFLRPIIYIAITLSFINQLRGQTLWLKARKECFVLFKKYLWGLKSMWHIKKKLQSKRKKKKKKEGKSLLLNYWYFVALLSLSLFLLFASMFIISHLSRSSNNNVLSSLRYRHIKHLSVLSQMTANNKSLKYWVFIFIRIQLPSILQPLLLWVLISFIHSDWYQTWKKFPLSVFKIFREMSMRKK